MFSMSVWIVVNSITLFWSAGRWDWPRGWLLIGMFVLAMPVDLWVMSRRSGVLLRERFRQHKGTESFDKGILLLFVPILLVIFCVAGLDERFQWSSLGVATIWRGIALFALGDALVVWVMAINPYLETTARIQEDRHQTVITRGPYRLVRHPMYLGGCIKAAGWPLIVGSAWAFLPVGALTLVYVIRTALEDRMLREKLSGYREYSQQTRYRLLPGGW
jgi:protein-S-isoprenylcysteine O-methyltransferase Ste14